MKRMLFGGLAVAATLLSGCATRPTTAVPTGKAEAVVKDLNGTTFGTVAFSNAEDRVKISVRLKGLTPNAQLGFHVHEKGECVGDFTSSGPHFDVHGKHHGRPGIASHIGDMGNLTTDKKGESKMELESEQMSLSPGENSIIGRAVIVHAQPDDMTSQPAGNAGKRIGCGVITEVK